MSFNNGGKLITNGLALCLDASNQKSYYGEQSSNLVLYSDTINGGSWTSYCAAFTTNVFYNTTESLAPDGSTNAVKVARDAATSCGTSGSWGFMWNSSSTIISQSVYTATVYAKGKVGGEGMNFGLNDAQLNGYTLTTNWQRLTYTAVAASTTGGIQFFAPNPNLTYYLWGAQLEQKPYATPYMSSGATTGSRPNFWGDLSGNAANSTFVGTSSFVSGSVMFDGSTGYATGNIPQFLSGGPFTLNAWIKLNTLGKEQHIIELKGSAGNGVQFYVSTGNVLKTSTYGNLIGSTTFTTGKWYMTTLARDSVTTSASFYVNGITDASGTLPNYGSSSLYYVGESNGLGAYNLSGSIGLAQIYNRVLSPTEILQNYNSSKGRFGL